MNRGLVLAVGWLVVLNVPAAWAEANVFLGKGAETWRKQLDSTDPSARRSAAFALGRLGAGAFDAGHDLVHHLARAREPDASVRAMAATALGDIARDLKSGQDTLWEQSGGMLDQLVKDDPDDRVRRSAAYALGAFGSRAAGATPSLTRALRDDRPSVRQNAAWALGQIGPQAAGAVDDLRQCLKDSDPLVRRDAAGAFGSMGKAGAAAGKDLIGLLKKESDSIVKKSALESLSCFAGPNLAGLADDLKPLVREKDVDIRFKAAIVLAKIGGDSAVAAAPILSDGLKDADPQVREMVAGALALPNSGSAARAAMDALAEALDDERNSEKMRGYAAVAISHIGPDAEKIVPTVARSLRSNQPKTVRQYAALALASIKYPANKEAFPAILDAIRNDKDGEVRHKCVWALFDIKSPEEFRRLGAAKALEDLLDDRSPDMTLARYDAARKLASVFNADAPDKTMDVLLDMYNNSTVKVYKGTASDVDSAGNEGRSGRAKVSDSLGGSARFMAVQAMGWLGAKAKGNRDIMKAIRESADSSDENLRKFAETALKDLDR